MAFREITPDFDPFDKTSTPTAPQKPKFAIPHLNLDDPANLANVKFLLTRIVISVALIWFGTTSTGSFFGASVNRYSGDMARVFYQWQAGTILISIGICILYDTYKHYY